MVALKEPSTLTEKGSSGSTPTIQSSKIDISSGVLAKQPGVVNIGNLFNFFSLDLSDGIKPVVVLNPFVKVFAKLFVWGYSGIRKRFLEKGGRFSRDLLNEIMYGLRQYSSFTTGMLLQVLVINPKQVLYCKYQFQNFDILPYIMIPYGYS